MKAADPAAREVRARGRSAVMTRVALDPRERAQRHAQKTGDVTRQSEQVFEPFASAVVAAIRRGGRVLLLGEGHLHPLVEYLARAVVGRDRPTGPSLAADPIAIHPAGAQATARCIGPFDVLLGISERCEEPLFRGVLDAARSRGAKVLCLCVGPSRLEGKADLGVDIPESRSHRIPGLLATVLHFIAKLALADLRANPMVRPSRLDEGPRRTAHRHVPPATAAPSAAGSGAGAPGAAAPRGALPAVLFAGSPPPFAPPPIEESPQDEPTITLEIPDDAFEIPFLDDGLGPEVFAPDDDTPTDDEDDGEGDDSYFGSDDSFDPDVSGEVALFPDDPEPIAAGSDPNLPSAKRSVLGRLSGVDLARAPSGPGASEPAEGDGDAGLRRIIMFRCKKCREPLLAEPNQAATRASCPFCGRRVKVPRSRGRRYRTGRGALSQGARRVSLQFGHEGCQLTIMPQGGFPIQARLADVTAEGIEASVRNEDAAGLQVGTVVRLRLITPAFLEPLFARAQLEQAVRDEVNGEEIGRLRLLLPLLGDTPHDVRERLRRLADLADRSASGGSRDPA